MKEPFLLILIGVLGFIAIIVLIYGFILEGVLVLFPQIWATYQIFFVNKKKNVEKEICKRNSQIV